MATDADGRPRRVDDARWWARVKGDFLGLLRECFRRVGGSSRRFHGRPSFLPCCSRVASLTCTASLLLPLRRRPEPSERPHMEKVCFFLGLWHQIIKEIRSDEMARREKLQQQQQRRRGGDDGGSTTALAAVQAAADAAAAAAARAEAAAADAMRQATAAASPPPPPAAGAADGH